MEGKDLVLIIGDCQFEAKAIESVCKTIDEEVQVLAVAAEKAGESLRKFSEELVLTLHGTHSFDIEDLTPLKVKSDHQSRMPAFRQLEGRGRKKKRY